MKQRVSKFQTFMYYGLLPLALLWEEILLLTATAGVYNFISVLYMMFFSVALGGVFFLLSTLFKSVKCNRVFRLIWLIAFAFLFSIIYLCYTEYGIFYDWKTMTAGAGGITEYVDEINMMVFSPKGMTHLILCYVPVFFYIVWGMILHKDNLIAAGATRRIHVFEGMLASVFIGWMLLANHEADWSLYTTEYTFAEAVPRFGLMHSLQKDIFHAITEKAGLGGSMSFSGVASGTKPETTNTEEEIVVVETISENEVSVSENTVSENEIVEVQEELPIVYEPNVLDIDFEALAEGANANLANLDYYVASLEPSMKNEYTGLFAGKNLIFITAEAFCAEAVDEKLTPTLYRMATKGIQVADYYQPAGAGTTGGEYQNVFGLLCTDGGASFKETATHLNYMTLGTQLTRLGYSGCTFHNGSLTYYDRHLTHVNIGYPDGYMATGNGYENLVEKGKNTYDTQLMAATLPLYMDKQPFNLYYMSISGHSPYSPYGNKFAGAHYQEMGDLPYSDMVKGYLSTQMELDAAMELTIQMLEDAGIADDTVIVISADHFPYGLKSDTTGNTYLEELYGQRIENDFILNHNRLIIWSGCLEKEEPIVVDSPVCSIDVLPTLLNLFGVEYDSRLLPGRDIFSDQEAIVFFTNYHWKTDLGTFAGSFVPNEGVEVPDGYVDRIKAIVKDKVTFCKGALWYDYYRHVFGQQVAEEEAEAAKAGTSQEEINQEGANDLPNAAEENEAENIESEEE
ncbi:MAG: LTA synthase family protein [Lachnospiraceae bacterium]|nr:LTA synthase family protein [Lachnospiraceae bacterium]